MDTSLIKGRKKEIESLFDSFKQEVNSVMTTIFDEGDELFSSVFNGKHTYPKLDISDEKDKYVVDATVPGLSKDDVEIKIEEHPGSIHKILIVQGKRGDGFQEEKRNFLRKEIRYSSFCRTIALPSDVDDNKITAKFENGILSILIPKKNSVVNTVKPIERKIEIK